jgi:hypothetical protein
VVLVGATPTLDLFPSHMPKPKPRPRSRAHIPRGPPKHPVSAVSASGSRGGSASVRGSGSGDDTGGGGDGDDGGGNRSGTSPNPSGTGLMAEISRAAERRRATGAIDRIVDGGTLHWNYGARIHLAEHREVQLTALTLFLVCQRLWRLAVAADVADAATAADREAADGPCSANCTGTSTTTTNTSVTMGGNELVGVGCASGCMHGSRALAVAPPCVELAILPDELWEEILVRVQFASWAHSLGSAAPRLLTDAQSELANVLIRRRRQVRQTLGDDDA